MLPPQNKPRLARAFCLAAACAVLAGGSSLGAQDAPQIAASPLPAAVVDAIPAALDAVAKQKLMEAGSYSSFFQGQPKTDLCPSPASAAEITRTLTVANPNIGIQTLVVAAMPAGLAGRADRDLALYNLLHQFRTMAGIQYYSSTHKAVRTLFTTSHLVRALGDRTPLPDPRYTAMDAFHGFLLEQDDTTFGKNLYSVSLKSLASGATELSMVNVERAWFGILPVLGAGALRLTVLIQPSADGKFLYFYGNVGIKGASGLGLEDQVRTSFHNRIIALYHWFVGQAARA